MVEEAEVVEEEEVRKNNKYFFKNLHSVFPFQVASEAEEAEEASEVVEVEAVGEDIMTVPRPK